jgi:hypothetical protein
MQTWGHESKNILLYDFWILHIITFFIYLDQGLATFSELWAALAIHIFVEGHKKN